MAELGREIQVVLVFLHALHMQAIGSATVISIRVQGIWKDMLITWNCTGSQSLLMVMVSLLLGLQNRYTRKSKISILSLGIGGTFCINILRICLDMLIFLHAGYRPAVLFHDYFADVLLLFWFSCFLCFTYLFVPEKKAGLQTDASADE